MVSRRWTRFSYFDWEIYRSRIDNVSQEVLLAAWSLLLFRKQDILDNHVAQGPFVPNQKGTKEMRDEVLWSVRAQDMYTKEYQASDVDNTEF